MRIAQIAPIVERLPPKKYGGTERVIYYLTEELVRRGHEVTLFATGDTISSAKVVSVVPKGLRELGVKDMYGFNIHALTNMGLAYAMAEQFDIIHDHNPHMGLPTGNIARTNVVMTWHGPFEGMAEYFVQFNRPHLVSISHAQARLAPSLRFTGNVYNGLPMEHYPFGENPKDYVLYVGRIDQEKGVHLAIDAAVALGKKMIIAAKLDDTVPHIKTYYDTEIAPRLEQQKHLVRWIGEVDETKRNELMSGALCLLHAVQWPEPFGLTLIEAQACGCPVVAFNLGSIPEVVQHGVTGYVVINLKQMVEAVRKIDEIDRAACRAWALERFSAKRMTDGYEAIYQRILQDRTRRIFSPMSPKFA